MRYVIDDTPIIEAEVITLPKPEVSHEVLLPIIDRQIEPNSIIIPKPTLISKTPSSIEIEQTFQCDVDYYGGVGIEQDGAVDTKLVKNPNTMTATLTGLTQDTEYTIKGVGLPILGNETIGEGLVVRTKPNPIPDEYQLVEYLMSSGTQYIITNFVPQTNNVRMEIKFSFVGIATQSLSGSQKTANSRLLYIRQYSSNTALFVSGNKTIDNGVHFSLIEEEAIATIEGNNSISTIGVNNITTNSGGSVINCDPLVLFAKSHYGSIIEIASAIINYCLLYDDNIMREGLYPVYRKSDSKPGMYDIVNNVFYTNQGSGEFLVGPDKEWEE